VPKSIKSLFSRIKIGVEKLKLIEKAKDVLYFVCEPNFLADYTFTVTATRQLRYKN
jgi:hypothetical protein